MVSFVELRELYGTWLNHDNLHMPMVQYLSMILNVVRLLTGYKGVHVCKMPNDLWIFQEIIAERQPTVIVEIGNQAGGSTMYLRDMLTLCVPEPTKVIGIDIDHSKLSEHVRDYPGIVWIEGDATTRGVINEARNHITADDRVMVIEDSSHDYENTLRVLKAWERHVTKGQYFIVEDTLLGEFVPSTAENAHDGAYKAVKEFMSLNKDFKIDRQREKWFITLNPEGYLEKIR